jgi:hypothetical protein
VSCSEKKDNARHFDLQTQNRNHFKLPLVLLNGKKIDHQALAQGGWWD